MIPLDTSKHTGRFPLLCTLLLCLAILMPLPVHADDDVTISTKILGGIEAKPGDWPWMVALLRADRKDIFNAQYCSGVLIDATWVLTAAHCVVDRSTSAVELAVGAYDLSRFSGPRISAKRLIVHPDYNTTNYQNDIALIEMTQAANLPTITLFSGLSKDGTPSDLIGIMLTAIGWGMADGAEYWYYPKVLRQVDLPVLPDSYCNKIYHTTLGSGQLCAGYYVGKDVCNGDSGGPVVTRIDEQWVHAGLVSYGTPCNKYYGWYGVYTRTSAYQDFIRQYVPNARFTSSPSLSWMLLLLK